MAYKIDYTHTPNQFNSAEVAAFIAATFCSDNADKQACYQAIALYLAQFTSKRMQSANMTELKEIKKQGFICLSSWLNTHDSKALGNDHLINIANSEPDLERCANILTTLVRWPEWFIHSEEYLKSLTNNIHDHMNEINAITYFDQDKRICPYSPYTLHDDRDWRATLTAQEPNVQEFCLREGISMHNVTAKQIISAMDELAVEICSDKQYFDSFESGFVNSVRHIRKQIGRVNQRMWQYKQGRATADMFGLSESRSVLSDYNKIMDVLIGMGFEKTSCPNVLANIFHAHYTGIQLEPQPGQIKLPELDLSYFQVAAGLGPAKKIRYVYNVSIEIQNFLDELAQTIKQADQQYDSVQEAYTHQLAGLVPELGLIKDAYCIDATGYSDYLFRGLYMWLFQLYGLDQQLADDIMTIFAFPLKVGGQKVAVEFGSMQGCKLLVFVMNHLNRLMGILARRLGAKIQQRHNAGDDVVSLSYDNTFDQSDIDIEMSIFAFFNCPTNPSKTAWLNRDGYFDFCSKYFARIEGRVCSITGIPPKYAGKQMLSISSFTEVFRILRTTNTARNPVLQVWEDMLPVLKPYLQMGCLLPNALHYDYELTNKIQLAANTSYLFGGLLEDEQVDINALGNRVINLLERLLMNYRFKATGVFKIVNMISDLQGTELYKALGSVAHANTTEVINMIATLKSFKEQEAVTIEDLEQAAELVARMSRNIVKGTSISATSSTYHRLTATRDIDCFISDQLLETPFLDSIESPQNQLQAIIFAVTMSDPNYSDPDNLRRYVQGHLAVDCLKDRIYQEVHGLYTNWYAIDDDGLVVKLTSQDRYTNYANKSGSYKSPGLIINPDIQLIFQFIAGRKEIADAIMHVSADVTNNVIEQAILKAVLKLQQRTADSVLQAAADRVLANYAERIRKRLEA